MRRSEILLSPAGGGVSLILSLLLGSAIAVPFYFPPSRWCYQQAIPIRYLLLIKRFGRSFPPDPPFRSSHASDLSKARILTQKRGIISRVERELLGGLALGMDASFMAGWPNRPGNQACALQADDVADDPVDKPNHGASLNEARLKIACLPRRSVCYGSFSIPAMRMRSGETTPFLPPGSDEPTISRRFDKPGQKYPEVYLRTRFVMVMPAQTCPGHQAVLR